MSASLRVTRLRVRRAMRLILYDACGSHGHHVPSRLLGGMRRRMRGWRRAAEEVADRRAQRCRKRRRSRRRPRAAAATQRRLRHARVRPLRPDRHDLLDRVGQEHLVRRARLRAANARVRGSGIPRRRRIEHVCTSDAGQDARRERRRDDLAADHREHVAHRALEHVPHGIGEQGLVGAGARAPPRARAGRRAGSWSCGGRAGPASNGRRENDRTRLPVRACRATVAPRAARPRSSSRRASAARRDAARHRDARRGVAEAVGGEHRVERRGQRGRRRRHRESRARPPRAPGARDGGAKQRAPAVDAQRLEQALAVARAAIEQRERRPRPRAMRPLIHSARSGRASTRLTRGLPSRGQRDRSERRLDDAARIPSALCSVSSYSASGSESAVMPPPAAKWIASGVTSAVRIAMFQSASPRQST